MFDGTLGTWKIDIVYFELKEDAKPKCSQPYPVPKAYEEMFKKEVENLVLLGVPEAENGSEWEAQFLEQPKPKSN